MNPEKEDTYQEGHLWLTGLRLKNKTNKEKQSLAAISTLGPALLGEACTELPASALNCLSALCFCHLSQPL